MDGTPTSQPLIGNYGTVGSVSFVKALNPDWAARANETYTGGLAFLFGQLRVNLRHLRLNKNTRDFGRM
jgi:hypothetical protein